MHFKSSPIRLVFLYFYSPVALDLKCTSSQALLDLIFKILFSPVALDFKFTSSVVLQDLNIKS